MKNNIVELSTLALKKVLNVKELSNYTGLSISWIYKLCQQGIIPHSKPNHKLIFFNKDLVDNWLLSNPSDSSESIERDAINYVANNPLKGGMI